MRHLDPNTLEGLSQFDRQLAWAVYLLNMGIRTMSLGRLEKLHEQALRMKASLDRGSAMADDVEQTVGSFLSNLDKLHEARIKVRDADNNIQATLKLMGNFDVDKIMGEGGEGGGTSTTQKPVTDINGVTLNPEAKK